MRFFIKIFLVFYFFIAKFTIAQEKDFSVNWETKAHYGFIFPHRSGMQNLILGHVKAFELNCDIPTFGKKEWEQIYNYPTWGFSFYHANLANPEQLGNATGIFPYINFSAVKKKNFQVNYHCGWGFAYVSKKFDRIENYKNVVIGSKFNAIASLGFEAEWKFSQRFSSSAGISLTHFSNGAYTVPNLGINIPTISAGISYYTGKTNKEFRYDSIFPFKKNYEITVIAAGGLKAVYPQGNPQKYPACAFNANFATLFSQKHQFITGFDLFYNSALLDYFERAEIQLKNNFEIVQPAIIFYYAATVSHTTILFGAGAYIYTRYKFDGPFYQRVGMRYKINEKLFANVTLKTHFFKADFSEWGIGYKF